MQHIQERVGLPGTPDRNACFTSRSARPPRRSSARSPVRSPPSSLLLGRYDNHGRLQYTGRTTTLAQAAGSAVAGLLASARRGHPWTGRPFCGRETLVVTLVEPELVVEVGVGVVRDTSGRWRDPARLHRARLGLSPGDVPRITALPRRHPSSTASTSPGWLTGCRLHHRYERKAEHFLAFVGIAAALIGYRRLAAPPTA
ncbi:hypothetical protein ACPCSD_35050 [Streptomyces griseoincarnatus]